MNRIGGIVVGCVINYVVWKTLDRIVGKYNI
jgi:hypothetical protein